MPQFLKILENYFVLYSRIFWIIISLISFIFIIFFLILGLNKFYFSQESIGEIAIPEWEKIETSIFPPRVKLEKSDTQKTIPTVEDITNLRLPVNALQNILFSIHKNFSDDNSNLAKIKFQITLRSLDDYLYNKKIKNLKLKNNVLPRVLNGLSDLFDTAYRSNQFIKIGDYNDRLNSVYSAIDFYFEEILIQQNKFAIEQKSIQLQNAKNQSQGLIYFSYAGYFVISFVTLVLFVIIFRVENHLKIMSKKEN
tara:strand:+ start:564 stop:1322 length:759 start_codon:yes stop_codon:yes gene_type:complete